MIKILHISQSHGGVKTYIDNIVNNNVNSNEYQHYLICSPDYGKSDIFHEQYMLPSFVRSPDVFNDFKAFRQILSLIKTIKPDLIHCHSSKGGLHGRFLAYITRIPCIFTPNGLSYLGFVGLKRKFFIGLERITKFNSFVMTVSNSEAVRSVEEIGYDANKVTYVQNFVRVPDECQRTYESHRRVGMIGRITQQKNPLLYLTIAKAITTEFPDVKFVLLGAGLHDHLYKEVDQFLDEHKLREAVIIEKWSTYPDIFDFYKKLDVFVLSSLFEGLSFSLLEAMSVGVPVVVTKVDGNQDVVNGTNGCVSNDVDVLVEGVRKLLVDHQFREKMGMTAYNYVKQHNNVDNVKAIYQNYSTLLSHQRINKNAGQLQMEPAGRI